MGTRGRWLLAALGLAAAAAGFVVAVSDDSFDGDSVAFDGRSPRAPAGERMRVLVQLQRPSLGERISSEPGLDAAAQHAHVRDLERESRALQSALNAKGVEVRDYVLFARVWSGFAATIDAADLTEVQTLGVRVEPVRRFYPAAALSQPLAVMSWSGGGLLAQPARRGAPAIALLDSGVEAGHPALSGRIQPGYDAVGRDRDPSPGRGPRGRREEHGTQVAGVLVDELPEGERILSVRVAGLQRAEETGGLAELGTTDQLMAGLEYAVDPNRDGDAADRIPVALAAVSSPYSGFPETPEAEAAGAARSLGTLVIAPAGNEGEPAGRFGTIGSPGAAAGALAVAALDGSGAAVPAVELGLASGGGRAKLDGTLLGGGGKPLEAPALALRGPSQANPGNEGPSLGADVLDYFGADGRPRAQGRVVVVPMSVRGREPVLAARASAAAAAGAKALVVADTGGEGLPPLTRAAGGAMPVIGLQGGDAERALELAADDGPLAFVSEPDERDSEGEARPAAASSRGPTYRLALKPDLAAPGTAVTAAAGGGEAFVSGTSVAAARAAAAAVEAHRARPKAPPAELAAALIGSAEPLGEPLATGAGRLRAGAVAPSPASGAPPASAVPPALAEPAVVSFPRRPASAGWTAAREVEFFNPGSEPVELRFRADTGEGGPEARPLPDRLRLPPNGRATVQLQLRGRGAQPGFAGGRLIGSAGERTVVVPFGVPLGEPPPARLGELRLVDETGGMRGVRFSAGSVSEQDGGRAVEPLGELVLKLVSADGETTRELTPPGGAVELLPGEYAYTLTRAVLEGLPAGSYTFTATARGPAGGATVEKRSASFEVE